MKKGPRGFQLKLSCFSDSGALGDSRTSEQSRGAFRGVERGGEELWCFLLL